MTMNKEIYKAQYKTEISQYDYIDKLDALKLSKEYYKNKLTLKERLDIYNTVFDY
tara:strand:+ start:748 stop:912 length:165 start_codon:yes stop_codon:yes gene_type:complete